MRYQSVSEADRIGQGTDFRNDPIGSSAYSGNSSGSQFGVQVMVYRSTER